MLVLAVGFACYRGSLFGVLMAVAMVVFICGTIQMSRGGARLIALHREFQRAKLSESSFHILAGLKKQSDGIYLLTCGMGMIAVGIGLASAIEN